MSRSTIGGRSAVAMPVAGDAAAAWCARVFLLIALPAMIALGLLLPPLQASDEDSHLLRAVGLSQGRILPEVMRHDPLYGGASSAGGHIDSGAADFVDRGFAELGHSASIASVRAMAATRASGHDRYAAYSNTAIYPPMPYVPATVAIAIARAIGLPVLGWLYLARLTNAVVAVAIGGWAIRRSGAAAPYLLIGATLPISLFQLASVTADAVLLMAVLVFCAMLHRIATGQPMRRHEQIACAIATVCIGAGKVAYLPFVALPPLACWAQARRITPALRGHALVAVVTILLWLAWAAIVQGKVFSIRPEIPVDPVAQLHMMFARPGRTIAVFARAMLGDVPRLFFGLSGARLGFFANELILPKPFVAMATLALVAAAMVAPRTIRMPPLLVAGVVAAAAISHLAIFLLLYLQFNAVGADVIDGVQGRYMTPLLLAVLAVTPRIGIGEAAMRRVRIAAALWSALSALVLLGFCLAHFWVW